MKGKLSTRKCITPSMDVLQGVSIKKIFELLNIPSQFSKFSFLENKLKFVNL